MSWTHTVFHLWHWLTFRLEFSVSVKYISFTMAFTTNKCIIVNCLVTIRLPLEYSFNICLPVHISYLRCCGLWKQSCTPSYMIYGDPPQTSQWALITSSNESQHIRVTCLKTKAELLSIQTAVAYIAEIRNIKKIWGFFGISAGGTDIYKGMEACPGCSPASHTWFTLRSSWTSQRAQRKWCPASLRDNYQAIVN